MVLSSKYASRYIDRLISDEESLIRYWFYTSIADEQQYDNSPYGDIYDIIDDWLNTLYGDGEDRTGLVDEFHGDKHLLLDYLAGWIEASQKKYTERSDRFFELWQESLEEEKPLYMVPYIQEIYDEETDLKSDLKIEGKVSEIST